MSLFLTMDATGLQFVAAATSIYPRHPRIIASDQTISYRPDLGNQSLVDSQNLFP